MTAIRGAMPADLAEAVRSLVCGACQAQRGEYCPCDGTHLARWELAAAAELVSEQHYWAAAEAAQPAPSGFPAGQRRHWLMGVPAVAVAAQCPPAGGARASTPGRPVTLNPTATPPGPYREPPAEPSLITGKAGSGRGIRAAGRAWVGAGPEPTTDCDSLLSML